MTRKAILLLLAVASTISCVAIPSKRSPRITRPRVSPNVVQAPAIRLEIHDRSSAPKKVARSVERARRKLPYLSRANSESVEYDYTIEVTVDHTAAPGPINELSALSLFVIPAWITTTVSATATVKDSEDGTLGTLQATGKNIEVVQMHLLWVAPVAFPLSLHVDRQMWNMTILNVFVQAGEIVARHRDERRETYHDSPGRAAILPVVTIPSQVLTLDWESGPTIRDFSTVPTSPPGREFRTVVLLAGRPHGHRISAGL